MKHELADLTAQLNEHKDRQYKYLEAEREARAVVESERDTQEERAFKLQREVGWVCQTSTISSQGLDWRVTIRGQPCTASMHKRMHQASESWVSDTASCGGMLLICPRDMYDQVFSGVGLAFTKVCLSHRCFDTVTSRNTPVG